MALLNRSRQALLVLSVALVALVVGSAGADGAPSAKNDCASQAWRVANSGPTLAYGAVIRAKLEHPRLLGQCNLRMCGINGHFLHRVVHRDLSI